MDAQSQDARAYFRVAVTIPARYALDGRVDLATGWIQDLSGGGVKLVAGEELPASAMVTVRFTLPDSAEAVVVRGRVVLSYREHPKGRFAHGVRFTTVEGRLRERIVRFVHALHQRQLQLQLQEGTD